MDTKRFQIFLVVEKGFSGYFVAKPEMARFADKEEAPWKPNLENV